MIAGRHMRPAIEDGTAHSVPDRHIVLRFQAEADPPAMIEPR
jgi:hypothetical protein